MAPKKEKSSNAGEISATVEESNKLRASLGIKPLATDSAASKSGTSNQPVHVPADKADGPSAADLKKQKAAAKTRKEHEELVKGEGLGDILAKEEGKGGAADWIARTRTKDGDMVKPTGAGADTKKRKAESADASVPKMKVRHDATAINEGESVTMTLSDQPLLDEDGNLNSAQDELSNVRMSDFEKAKHNAALKGQVDYDPTKDGQQILEKYDELKTGPTGFVVGGTVGVIDETDPEKRLAILTKMGEQQSLEMKAKLQADYYTSEEMAGQFRKAPKKKTKRRKGGEKDKEDQIGVTPTGAAAPAPRPTDAGSDEEDPELYEQLSKQRRLVKKSEAGVMKKGEAALNAVSERISAIDPEKKDDEEETGEAAKKVKDAEKIAMTATTEFCNVVQTPLEKLDTLKHESYRGSTLYKQQVTQRKGIAAGERRARKAGAAAGSMAMGDEAKASIAQLEEDVENLQEEGLDLSCASGLAYLRARAQIGNDQESHKFKKSDNRPLEMSTVDGDIKLEYRDDFGRVQTPKEAFRAISWKFHGKVPGRKNMERRLVRLENEMKLKAMNPMEQLPTLRALRHVQVSDAKPYMVLSGANEK